MRLSVLYKIRLSVQALALIGCVLWLTPVCAIAERFPVKTYGTPDGLGSSFINGIIQDSRGFLWVCTRDGLSRFDGHKFKTYKTSDGLPIPAVTAILENQDGTFWVTTNGGGVCKFNPAGRKAASSNDHGGTLFTTYRLDKSELSNRVNQLYRDSEKRIWLGTDDGLFRLNHESGKVTFELVPMCTDSYQDQRQPAVNEIIEDSNREIWVALSRNGLYRIFKDGRGRHYSAPQYNALATPVALLEDRRGRLWVGTTAGLCMVESSPGLDALQVQHYSEKNGLAHNKVNSLIKTLDGHLWIGSPNGLSEFDGSGFKAFNKGSGLDGAVNQLLEDRDRNLWIGTPSDGLLKFARNGFSTYGGTGDRGLSDIQNIFEDEAGNLWVVSSDWYLSQIGAKEVLSIRMNMPAEATSTWLSNAVVRDHRGEFWAVTDGLGVFRFPSVGDIRQLARLKPKAIYTLKTGLSSNYVGSIFEDLRGDIWFRITNKLPLQMGHWERATETFRSYTKADGLPELSGLSAFYRAPDGDLWLTFFGGKIYRYRDGRFISFIEPEAPQRDSITALFVDSQKRLWIADNKTGVARIDNPTSDQPLKVNYGVAQGLSSDNARCIGEDRWGRIYIGTVRGVDRINTATGKVKNFSSADGLSSDFTKQIYRDREDNLWIGTLNGISKFTPEPPADSLPPAVIISGLRVAGEAQALNELGETDIGNLEFDAGRNQLQIDFTAPAFGLGESLRFQYKLEGANQQWSPLTELRSVNYANLSPGSYRFLVRAVNGEGIASDVPAYVHFTILPPLTQRWWFLLTLGLLLCAAIYLFFRYRVNRLLEIERVRTRIAADLHDDIGASLSHIAVVSEVVKRQLPEQETALSKNLSVMARKSREAVDSMSDIVWAINPQRDHLYDLTRRMRNFASELLPARDIAFEFKAPGGEQDIRLGADVRRQMFLIYKESLNNLVRHSGCTEARIEIYMEGKQLVLRVSDNGRGFTPAENWRGNGLKNMKKRAESLKGRLDFITFQNCGTTVILEMPHHPAPTFTYGL
jgi:ligand-binding sensor domain-containing protein/two-component sensor histidine kinase